MFKGSEEPPSYSRHAPPHHSSGALRVCCITLNETDKIRLIGTPPELANPIRQAIVRAWGRIQKESDYAGAHQFKLLGNPWSARGNEGVLSRRLVVDILKTMAQHGWTLIQSADVSRKEYEKDSLFFESSALQPVDVGPIDMFAISLNRTDRIRLIDAPSEFRDIVRQAIKTQWKLGIMREDMYFSSFEFKLSGNPFCPQGEETVHSRMMLSQMLAAMAAHGYRLYASVDISNGDAEGRDLHSWFFRRVTRTWPSRAIADPGLSVI